MHSAASLRVSGSCHALGSESQGEWELPLGDLTCCRVSGGCYMLCAFICLRIEWRPYLLAAMVLQLRTTACSALCIA